MKKTTEQETLPVVTTGYDLVDESRMVKVGRQVALIRQFVKEQLNVDEDYGIIPGTKKNTLYKSGAEKFCLLFNVVPEYTVDVDVFDSNHRNFRFGCVLIERDSQRVIGRGVSSCSTLESKYRYRSGKVMTEYQVPPSYWNKALSFEQKNQILADNYQDDGDFKLGIIKNELTGKWHIAKLMSGENPDIADCYNTCYKIGKKRALVDAVISTGACGDLFTQDMEEGHIIEDDDPVVLKDDKAVMPKLLFGYDVQGLSEDDAKEIWTEAKPLGRSMGADKLLWTSAKLSDKWTMRLEKYPDDI